MKFLSEHGSVGLTRHSPCLFKNFNVLAYHLLMYGFKGNVLFNDKKMKALFLVIEVLPEID